MTDSKGHPASREKCTIIVHRTGATHKSPSWWPGVPGWAKLHNVTKYDTQNVKNVTLAWPYGNRYYKWTTPIIKYGLHSLLWALFPFLSEVFPAWQLARAERLVWTATQRASSHESRVLVSVLETVIPGEVRFTGLGKLLGYCYHRKSCDIA